jgi:hypothetical protein
MILEDLMGKGVPPFRREHDLAHANSRRIDDLIEMTEDPVQKATLLVLSKIDSALDANTAATNRIAVELAEHRDDVKNFRGEFAKHDKIETEDRAKLVGARSVAMGVFGFISVLFAVLAAMGTFILSDHRGKLQDAERGVMELRLEVSRLKSEIAR